LAPLFFCVSLFEYAKTGSNMKSTLSAAVAAVLLLTSPVCAAQDTQNQGSLAPGGAAGVAQAQNLSAPLILSIVGVVGVAAAAIILVSNSHHASAPKTTTKS
jgi:hypothetical protein